ncbi:YcnI family protein [Paenibacillus sp. MMS20-IR301]|uniref:YcnI family copper-binding membrane protein n=1 Tax=Paenibacillus sp. MMS20-IR301 TaxID=2895946 RepID=UPI0028F02F77|nr:YcnI family protein [Paenibacillus sp. MMS20-IR301]WNS45875.1 YcnI family protein [Paenibacillus sp. MMS20-IR301]
MNPLFRKIAALTAPAAAALMLFAAVASAHVTVSPAESSTGAWETYTLKVPSEKDIATVQVDLRIPEGAEFKQYEPAPGWDVTVEGNKVSWTASGEGILAGQFQRFYFTAKNPDTAGDIAWNAYQHYADGSVVQWSGEEGSEAPHSVTSIVQASGGDSHSHGSMDMSDGGSMTMDEHQAIMEEEGNNSGTSPMIYIALGISLLSFLLAAIALLRGKKE